MNNWLKNNQKLNLAVLFQQLIKQNCSLCAATVNGKLSICEDCLAGLPLAPHPNCSQCGLKTHGETCGKCQKNKPHYDHTHALFTYAYPVDAIMQHYKYNNAHYLSQTFGMLLSEKNVDFDIDVIIPMPLHPNRIKTRGFNQSLEVAKVMAKLLNVKCDTRSCNRIKDTLPQASLAVKERLKNMKGAFNCQKTFVGQHVVLIDDVMTTGASLNELAKTIKKAGAEKVSCYVLARTE
ncbi:MAG: ComF family protein [Methylophilaceae bacterium]